MNNEFLRHVSEDLIKRFGNNLSNVTVVFPGKRARLFMNQYLAQTNGKPVWAPQYKTIDELYSQISSYRKAEPIETISLLYSIYCELVPDAEPLDEFYSWGEIILGDFDDIDKHLAPADKIFHNVYDLHSISTDYLTEEQEKTLREFFHNFSKEGNSILKERFLRLWEIMPDMYTTLRQRLMERGILYSGALYREVAQRLKNGEEDNLGEGKTFTFIGFNILDECEETLFRHCKECHNALFYWDYDELYINDPAWEAGFFINQNRRIFPNALEDECYDNLSRLKDITLVATSTNNAQTRYIPTWLGNTLDKKDGTEHKEENKTAIILGDEHMLGSVLHSIPENTPELINVTMGYPMSDTPVFSFLNVLMSLYLDGFDTAAQQYRFTYMQRLCRHPYYHLIEEEEEYLLKPSMIETKELIERLTRAVDVISRHFSQKEHPDVYDQLYNEALFKTHTQLQKFAELTSEGENGEKPLLDILPHTMRSLLKQILLSTSIPFHGEPAVGMQVMGLLETRNLDFENILMLNVEEGVLPKKSEDNSFIPYSLKESFGLTTIKHKISVFAYYFYRILARAEHVTLMYNENSSGVGGCEMSRFLRQLMAETSLPIKHVRLMPTNDRNMEKASSQIVKTDEMVKSLREKYINNNNHKLSPTAINTYLKCKMQFYYKYIANIRIDDKPEDGITRPIFGTVFHDSADMFYRHTMKHYGTNVINSETLQLALKNKETMIYPFVNISLIYNFFKPLDDDDKEKMFEKIETYSYQKILELADNFYNNPRNANLLTGLNHIIHSVLKQFILQLINYDCKHAPFTLESLEKDYYYELKLSEDEKIITGGRVDRLERDSKDRLVVVDYKTGGKPEPERSIDSIIEHKTMHADYFLQTFLYAMAVKQTFNAECVQPTLFYVNKASKADSYDRTLLIGTATNNQAVLNVADVQEEFTEKLRDAISTLFDKDTPFTQTENQTICNNCKYREICK